MSSIEKLEQLLPSEQQDVIQELYQQHAGVIGVKANGKCAFVNHYAIEKLGYYRAKELIGKNIIELLQPDDHHKANELSAADFLLKQINSGEQINANPAFLCVSDNGHLNVNYWIYPLDTNENQIKAIFCFKTDATCCDKELASPSILARFKCLIDCEQIILWEYDLNSQCFSFVSPQVVTMFGYPLISWYSKTFWNDHIHPQDQQLVIDKCQQLANESDAFTLEYRMLNAKQEVVYIRDCISVIKATGSSHKFLRGIFVDISAEKIKEEQLKLTNIAFDAADPLVITDACGVIVKANKAYSQMIGYTAQECLGNKMSMFSSGQHSDAFYQNMWQDLTNRFHWQGKITNKHKSGEIKSFWLVITAVQDDFGKISHYVGDYSDLTEKKAVQAQIHYQANYDVLTGLANRDLLFHSLKQAIIEASSVHFFGALLLIDLDDFTFVNDSLGHKWGDKLLNHVGERLSKKISKGDILARMGGDEFAILVPMISADKISAGSAISQYAQKIKETLSLSFNIKSQEVFLTQSIGIAFFPNHDADANDVFRQADTALYHAKKQGKDQLCEFSPEMAEIMERGMTIRNDLAEAIKQDQLSLYLQPVLNRHGKLVSAEALLRWQHPIEGWISPAEFIPIAEKSGLILPIGQWVFQQACTLLDDWLQQGEPPINQLAINVSSHQFNNPEFLSLVKSSLAENIALAQMLEFELTEEVLVGDVTATTNTFNELRNLGVQIAIDDFGTGYSSLSYLKRLPIDKLKIDRSFVMDIPQDKNDEAIVKTIIAMAVALGLKVTAEGVETEHQLHFLQNLHCDFYQGYYYSRPLPIAEFERFALENRKQWLRKNID